MRYIRPFLCSAKCAAKNIITARHISFGNKQLRETDPELWDLVHTEKRRQKSTIDLIASENFTSRAVSECVGSCLTNKYAEGYPGARYYGGNEIVDKIERLAQSRLLSLYKLSSTDGSDLKDCHWGVNVQPYSGSPANLAAFTGLLNPHERIMGLNLPDGGHLTHGFYTPNKRISATSIFFESMPYKLNTETELIDYDALQRDASTFLPKVIIAGITAYPRLLDYARFRKICDSVGALLLADMSHISGLVAAGVVPSPFELADVVTSTTHKTLRGPRSGMIFYRRTPRPGAPESQANIDFESRINNAVFPSLQGGPHLNAIAGLAAMAAEASCPDFKTYSEQVLRNAKAFGKALQSYGIDLVSGGTEVHFVLANLTRSSGKPGLGPGDGVRVQLAADLAGIVLNKNTVVGDRSAMHPSGLRLGTPAMTSRGLNEADFECVAGFLSELLDITVAAKSVSTNLKTFRAALVEDKNVVADLASLKQRVAEFCNQFPMPGFEDF